MGATLTLAQTTDSRCLSVIYSTRRPCWRHDRMRTKLARASVVGASSVTGHPATSRCLNRTSGLPSATRKGRWPPAWLSRLLVANNDPPNSNIPRHSLCAISSTGAMRQS